MDAPQPEPAASAPTATWAVWRVDASGLTRKVRGGLTQAEAYRAMGGLAVRGTGGGRLWVEAEPAEPGAAPDPARMWAFPNS